MEIRIDERFYKGPPDNFHKFCCREFGTPTAKLIARRLEHVRASTDLSGLMRQGFPGRWHWLTGNRQYQVSADLKGLERLIFLPFEDPAEFTVPNLDNKKIKGLIVFEKADTHNE